MIKVGPRPNNFFKAFNGIVGKATSFASSIVNVGTVKRKAAGGLIFIFTATIGAVTLNGITKLSTEDLTKSMVNQSAYFVTYRAATYLYNSNAPSGTYTTVGDKSSGVTVNMLSEYNALLKGAFDGKAGRCGSFAVRWDKVTKTATSVNVGSVGTILNGSPVTPDTQVVVAE